MTLTIWSGPLINSPDMTDTLSDKQGKIPLVNTAHTDYNTQKAIGRNDPYVFNFNLNTIKLLRHLS